MMKKLAIAAVAALGLIGSAANAAELLTNGSFESSLNIANGNGNGVDYCVATNGCTLNGWSAAGNQVYGVLGTSSVWGTPGTADGAQLAAIQQTGALTQAFNGGGGTYTLSWYDAGRSGFSTTETYDVLFNNLVVGSYTALSTDAWGVNSLTFNSVAAGAGTVSFVGTTTGVDASVLIDKVSLVGAAAPVPEPESIAMMLAGLGILGVMGRRQRKNA